MNKRTLVISGVGIGLLFFGQSILSNLARKDEILYVRSTPQSSQINSDDSKYPFIEQQDYNDCGIASLAMIGKYWGKKVNINSLRQAADLNSQGISLLGLKLLAESLKFNARPVKATLDGIEKSADPSNPWIAHWKEDHFVVVYRITTNSILVADPAEGKQWISRQKFQDSWTGYALLLKPIN